MSSVISETEYVRFEIIKSATSLFFDGICILLAVQACYLLRRRKSSGHGVLTWAMVLACSFGIAKMIHQVVFTAMLLGWYQSVKETERLPRGPFERLAQMKTQQDGIFLLINNFFADSLFIYRCYVIWAESRSRRQVVCIPLLLALLITTLGIVIVSLLPNHSGMNELFIVAIVGMIMVNLILTGLTAGRIWWTRRQLQVTVNGKTTLIRRHNTAIAILLESSAVYLVFMVLFLIAENLGSATLFSPGISVLSGASGQLMNISPALLVVRVSLTRSVDVDPTADTHLKLESSAY
ncbi:hypothetical protein MVEN_00370000 [Mycena venus]|uniref:Uncharacterized protein n=1 Tax=Mycena venus TaxID=2733690 RepID=A0A8H7D888_9AGAR|nr:hypothetical protein MVEN_00370000 [Mycena venus]